MLCRVFRLFVYVSCGMYVRVWFLRTFLVASHLNAKLALALRLGCVVLHTYAMIFVCEKYRT